MTLDLPVRSRLQVILLNFGCLLVAFGLVTLRVGLEVNFIQRELYSMSLVYTPWWLSYVIYVIGIGILFSAWISCRGVNRNHNGLMFAFACTLSGIVFFQIYVGAMVLACTAKVGLVTHEAMLRAMQTYFLTRRKDTRSVWDTFQRDFKCCGGRSPSDWVMIPPSGGSHPTSCGVWGKPQDLPGCMDKLILQTSHLFPLCGYFLIAMAILEVFGILVGACIIGASETTEEVPLAAIIPETKSKLESRSSIRLEKKELLTRQEMTTLPYAIKSAGDSSLRSSTTTVPGRSSEMMKSLQGSQNLLLFDSTQELSSDQTQE